MLTIKLIAMIIGVPVVSFLLAALLSAIASYAFCVSIQSPSWEMRHLEDPRAEKIRSKIMLGSLALGFLVSGVFLYAVFFMGFSLGDWLEMLKNSLSIQVSPSVATAAGVVAGALWAIQMEREYSVAKWYAASTSMSVQEKFNATRRLRRNTMLAMALVLAALLLTLLLPGETSILLVPLLIGISTVFVNARWGAY